MKPLPLGVQVYKRTPEFNATSVPAGLLRAHSTKAGTWGRIVVVEGRLRYRILEPHREEHLLDPDHPGIVEPTVRHEVEPVGDVRFHVEFYREPDV